jgi:hypothetical protein
MDCSGFALRLFGHEQLGSGGVSASAAQQGQQDHGQHRDWPTNASPGLGREGKEVAMLSSKRSTA